MQRWGVHEYSKKNPSSPLRKTGVRVSEGGVVDEAEEAGKAKSQDVL